MSDAALRRTIKRAAAEVPAAPWLHDRVMAAIAIDAMHPPRWRLHLPTLRGLSVVAAIVLATLVVGILIGSRLAGSGPVAPAKAPSRDPAAVRYSSMVGRDVGVIDMDYSRHFSCKNRSDCAAQLRQIETDTETLLADLSNSSVPNGESTTTARLRVAAEDLVIELQAAVATVEQPGSNFIAASSAPGIDNLDLAAAVVECWPLPAVVGDHGIQCS